MSETHVLRVTQGDWSNGQGLFFTLEPCLSDIVRNPSCHIYGGIAKGCYLIAYLKPTHTH